MPFRTWLGSDPPPLTLDITRHKNSTDSTLIVEPFVTNKNPVLPRETRVGQTSVKCAIYAVSWHLDAQRRDARRH